MKDTANRFKHLGLILLVATGCGLLASCKSSDRSMAAKWGDHQVASGVKKEFSKDPSYKYQDVVPVVRDGIVQLSGYVNTPEQRQRAAELAAHAKGVKQVINSIELKPTPTGPEMVQTNAPAAPPSATPQPTAAPGTGSQTQQPKTNQ